MIEEVEVVNVRSSSSRCLAGRIGKIIAAKISGTTDYYHLDIEGPNPSGLWEEEIRLTKEGKKMSEVSIREEVAEVFENTKDAVVVEKYVGSSIGRGFVTKLILRTYKKEILEEAYRRKREEMEKEK